MNIRAGLACAFVALAAVASGSHAAVVLNNGDSVPVNQILNGDRQFIIGDKLFTILAYNAPSAALAQSSLVAAISPNPLQGIGFDLFGPFNDVPGDATPTDFAFRYTVEILPSFIPQGFRLIDNILAFNGAASGTGSYASVEETILTADGLTVVGQKSVFDIVGPPRQLNLDDRFVFGPPGYIKLEIIKNMQFFANGPGGTARASFVRQSFSQIPAPGAIAIVALGSFVVVRRRR